MSSTTVAALVNAIGIIPPLTETNSPSTFGQAASTTTTASASSLTANGSMATNGGNTSNLNDLSANFANLINSSIDDRVYKKEKQILIEFESTLSKQKKVMGVACTLNTTHLLMDKYVNGSKFFTLTTISFYCLVSLLRPSPILYLLTCHETGG